MGAFFGLLIGLGLLCYTSYKSNQQIAKMQNNFQNNYGERGKSYSSQEVPLANKYFKIVLNYFNDRFHYYMSNPEFVMNKMEFTTDERNQSQEALEFALRWNAGYLAFKDVNTKYAPQYEYYYDTPDNFMQGSLRLQCPKVGGISNICNVALALARKELYDQGWTPTHMLTRQSPFYSRALYFYSAKCSATELGEWRESMEDPKWFGLSNGKYYYELKKPAKMITDKVMMEKYSKLKQEGKIK
ncbi:MAG: hypothetical protein IJF54_01670 [Clostridia bacterium]|nr:hypothetical protein [Clostridia bacterium]